ncbi:hypothetical protein DPMN_033855 [Dreissena polymorpha]|uniref:Uncharacterized protein n=1 Tax=Dreissena polymorpha TaxID=45954 RepID=A0A9D4M4K0_DREPO|nr:hypothetical protein DPMN_033855 [Dreissena polymorpha]
MNNSSNKKKQARGRDQDRNHIHKQIYKYRHRPWKLTLKIKEDIPRPFDWLKANPMLYTKSKKSKKKYKKGKDYT